MHDGIKTKKVVDFATFSAFMKVVFEEEKEKRMKEIYVKAPAGEVPRVVIEVSADYLSTVWTAFEEAVKTKPFEDNRAQRERLDRIMRDMGEAVELYEQLGRIKRFMK